MNILIVHEVDYNKKVVFEFQMLAELLSLKGDSVYVLDYESMWKKKHLFDLVSHIKQIKVSRAYPESKVILTRPSFIKIPILSRITAFISHYFTVRDIIRNYNIDLILLYSVPTNGWQTIHWAKKYDIPIIFRSIDSLHCIVQNKLLSKITKYLEHYVYSKVDKILTISPSLTNYVKI